MENMINPGMNGVPEEIAAPMAGFDTIIVAILDQKGGVGKTTTTITLADILAILGEPTLVIDMDPQANATSVLSYNYQDERNERGDGPRKNYRKGAYELLLGKEEPGSLVKTSVFNKLLQYVPAGDGLKNADEELDGIKKLAEKYYEMINGENDLTESFKLELMQYIKEQKDIPQNLLNAIGAEDREAIEVVSMLRDRVKPFIGRYKYILIDCCPAQNVITKNAMVASDFVVSPVNAEGFSQDGIDTVLRNVYEMQKYNPDLMFGGAILTRVKSNVTMARQMTNQFIADLEDDIVKRVIREDNAVSVANTLGKPIYMSERRTKAGTDYIHVAYLLGLIDEGNFEYMLDQYGMKNDNYKFRFGTEAQEVQ